MDDIDLASEREEAHRGNALALTLTPLRRIATGTGSCRLCGDPTEADRLAALPGAPHCADCAAEVEEDRQRAARTGGIAK